MQTGRPISVGGASLRGLAWAVPVESQTAMRCACWRATRHLELRYMYLVYERLAAILPCIFPIIHTRCEFHDALQTHITPFHSEYPRLPHLKHGVHPTDVQIRNPPKPPTRSTFPYWRIPVLVPANTSCS